MTDISRSYSYGWRPETASKQVALDMISIIFDDSASVNDCRIAAATLVEAVYPEILPRQIDMAKVNESFRAWCREKGQFP